MKFNYFTKRKIQTTNHEGAKAYVMTPEYELYSAVVTAGLSDTFYESSDKRLSRIQGLMNQCSTDFIARLAVYTRTQMYLRSVSMVLLVELAKRKQVSSVLMNAVPKVVQRADEITELLAYYQIANKRTEQKKLNKLSKQLQKGLAFSFNQFDEYQFAKYNRNTAVKLKDALFLVHPKAKNDEQQKIFDKIAKDTLAVPYTWETELSAVGQNKYASIQIQNLAVTAKWEELIDSNKLGYMALMRNLRNILEANVSAIHIEKVTNTISNANAVEKSKQLPFRFLAAYRELKKVNSRYTAELLDALEDAIAISAKNIKGFGFNTSVLIACDVSSSMQIPISPKSSVLLYDIGLVLAMIMKSRCKNVISGIFGDSWKIVNMNQKSVLKNVDDFYKREGEVGYSTNGYLVIEDLIKRNEIIDKVMLFTDVQMYDSSRMGNSFEKSWNKYKQIAPEAKLYVFDLAGHGNVPLSMERNDVFLIAGWSDKIFDILNALDNKSDVIETINAIAI